MSNTTVGSLKQYYVKKGGKLSDVENISTIPGMIDAITALPGGGEPGGDYVTHEELAADLEDYAKVEDIPDVSEFVVEDDILEPVNLFNLQDCEVLENCYVNAQGNISQGDYHNVIKFPCNENSEYTFSFIGYSYGLFSNSAEALYVKDALDQHEQAYTIKTDRQNTKFIYVSVSKSDYDSSTYMIVKGNKLPQTYVPQDQKQIKSEIIAYNLDDYATREELSEEFVIEDDILEPINLFNLQDCEVLDGYYLNANGQLVQASYYIVIKFPCDEYTKYTFSRLAYSYGLFTSNAELLYVKANLDQHEQAYTIETDVQNTKFIYVSVIKNEYDSSTYMIVKGDKLPSVYVPQDQKQIKAEIMNTEAIEEVVKAMDSITICCTGDSVTEGMATRGAHYANYGDSPYPARLKTLLVDNGYNNVNVINCGHGGERIAEITARIGGLPCVTTEDITIPSNNTPVSLGVGVVTSGRVSGTKLIVPYVDDNDVDFNVLFKQTSHDTNPLFIDGIEYNLTISENENFIAKKTADNKETVIPAGTVLLTNNNHHADVNVIYSGINDGSSLTLKRWVDNTLACGAINGNRYIVLGSTSPLFRYWSDITGDNDQKYATYKRKCLENFGLHFIDLYDEFSRHAMDYTLEAGYFSDKTTEEINEMRTKLSNHIIPAEMSYDGQHENDVHLNEAGYYVIGRLVFERLKRLNYI